MQTILGSHVLAVSCTKFERYPFSSFGLETSWREQRRDLLVTRSGRREQNLELVPGEKKKKKLRSVREMSSNFPIIIWLHRSTNKMFVLLLPMLDFIIDFILGEDAEFQFIVLDNLPSSRLRLHRTSVCNSNALDVLSMRSAADSPKKNSRSFHRGFIPRRWRLGVAKEVIYTSLCKTRFVSEKRAV